MAKVFYDHLVKIEELTVELEACELGNEEKEEILAIIDQTLHCHVFNIILTHLPKEHHRTFLEGFHQSPDSSDLLAFLKNEIKVDIEKVIKAQAEKIKKEILSEIKKAKSNS